MGSYDVAQVCLNGHLATAYHTSHPEHRKAFCDECGAPTIYLCTSCREPIRGGYYATGVISLGSSYSRASYCYSCGKPYPWTAAKLEAARAMADELDELNGAEREELKKSI